MQQPTKNKCSVQGCTNKYDCKGYCGMHNMRVKRYCDPNYITPEEIRVEKLRNAQPTLGHVQAHTYKKLFGRHEHRRVMEEKLGRKLHSKEIVHHIDGNKHNNLPENLELITQSNHIRKHIKEMNLIRAYRKLNKNNLPKHIPVIVVKEWSD